MLAVVLGRPCNVHPVYALQPVLRNVRVQRSGPSYTASAELTFDIRQKTAPAVPSKDPGLLAHVRGHKIVAQRVAQSSNGTIRATGNTPAQARGRLRDGVTQTQRDLSKELDREESVYDSVTQNGAAQSQGPVYGFPGGPDARDVCVSH
jgi:Bacterial protein of unknown function (DUF922)